MWGLHVDPCPYIDTGGGFCPATAKTRFQRIILWAWVATGNFLYISFACAESRAGIALFDWTGV